MKINTAFLKISAIAALLSAITTFFLWLLPHYYKVPSVFTEAVNMHTNNFYIARLWVNFWHIPLALTGYFGLVTVLFKRAKAVAIFGMLWFCFWGLIEMIGIAVILFSVNFNWRKNFSAADEAGKEIFKTNIEGFYSIWDSMFFVLLIAFLIASVCFAFATWKGAKQQRILSVLLWLSVPLSIFIIIAEYANQAWAGSLSDLIYPFLQPASRGVMAWVIWDETKRQNVK